MVHRAAVNKLLIYIYFLKGESAFGWEGKYPGGDIKATDHFNTLSYR